MGRGGILFLGAFSIVWMYLAFRFGFPGHELKLTLLCGFAQAGLAIELFLKCRCDEKKNASGRDQLQH
jgi:hypothetical protein